MRHPLKTVALMLAAALLPGAAAVGQASLPLPESCRLPTDGGIDALLASESRSGRRALRSAEDWSRLACVRAALEAAGAVGSRTGPEMALGDAWAFGALGAARRAVLLDAGSAGADVLGWVAARERPEDLPPDVLPLLKTAVDRGRRTPSVLRGCTQLGLENRERRLAYSCSAYALEAGFDSTFHLTRQARIAYAEGRDSVGDVLFHRAAAVVAGVSAREELRWHLRWFLTPEELAQESTLPDSAVGAWVRDRLAARDVRDARPRGARLREHFERLEFVMTNFRLRLHRGAWKAGGLVGAVPEDNIDPDAVRQSCEPGTVPARRYRFYDRWQGEIDDRGAVWMRFGPPEKRVRAAPTCPTAPGSSANLREAWLYRIDGVELLLHFENERYDGATGATRLVTGVLGSYLCDVSAWRCALTERAKQRGQPLPLEQLNRAIENDAEMLTLATTRDDNAIRSEDGLGVRARVLRLWSPRSGSPLSLVTWAVRLQDLDRGTPSDEARTQLALAIRRWSRTEAEWHDTTLVRSYPTPANPSSGAALTGALVLPQGHATSDWSVSIAQPSGRTGRAWGQQSDVVRSAGLELSDLVIGDVSQGLRWRDGDLDVPLAPLDAIPRDRRASVFLQIRSPEAMTGIRLRVAILRGAASGPDARPSLQVSGDQGVEEGITTVQRELDLGRVDKGIHRVRVSLLDSEGREIAARETTIAIT